MQAAASRQHNKARVDPTISIDALLSACRQGDPLAWEALVRRFQDRVYATCYLYLRNTQDAEELAQEAFIHVYRNLGKYHGNGDGFTGWLLRVTRNACFDRLRYNKARLPPYRGVADHEPDATADHTLAPDRALALAQEQALIHDALSRADTETRDLIVLKDIQELSIQEVAAILQIPLGTVKSKCHRARLALARLIRRAHPLYGGERSHD